MKPIKPMMCFSIVALLCNACVTTPGDTETSAKVPVTTTCTAGSTGMEFVKAKVQWVKNFDANYNGGSDEDYSHPYAPPQPLGIPDNQQILDNLGNAFYNAPRAFQQALCNLDYVFVDQNPTNPSAWGFYEVPDEIGIRKQGNLKRTFIGLSEELLVKPPTISQYETELLWKILDIDDDKDDGTFKPTYTAYPDTADTADMAIISMLAHEMGHLIWYPNGQPIKKLCGGSFYKQSWEKVD